MVNIIITLIVAFIYPLFIIALLGFLDGYYKQAPDQSKFYKYFLQLGILYHTKKSIKKVMKQNEDIKENK